MIDTGLPVGQFTDVVQSHGDLVDLVKLGWGTAVVTRRLPEKLDRLREALQARPYVAPGRPQTASTPAWAGGPGRSPLASGST